MTPLPDNLLDIDLKSALFIVVLLAWSWAVAFSLIMAWRMAMRSKSKRWAFSIRQLFVALTTIAVVIGLTAAMIRW
jgi:hypothetical protein